jgi:hypothetical protein
MKYFKNTELANLYNVSEKSVRNWIESARMGKLDIQLYEHKGKMYVANVSKNTALIEDLVQKGKKFKNTRGFKSISPRPEFYETYSEKQILDIVSNMTIHHEVPIHYSYADGGAMYWDSYANRLSNEQTPNILNRTLELLDMASAHIDQLVAGHDKINIIDLGPGNGLPIRSILGRILAQGKLNRYIAIDGSKEMLHILEQNIGEWFDGKVPFESHVRDFSQERFDDLFTHDHADSKGNFPLNMVFLLGGTLNNFRSPSHCLQDINRSMGLNDSLFYTGYLDTPSNRRYFDFNASQGQKLRSELILTPLGVDDSLYTIEQLFNREKRARSISFKPKIDLSIKVELPNGARYVELRKNEPILLWRHWHKNAVETINQFDQNEFDVVHASKSPDGEYFLAICKIKTES